MGNQFSWPKRIQSSDQCTQTRCIVQPHSIVAEIAKHCARRNSTCCSTPISQRCRDSAAAKLGSTTKDTHGPISATRTSPPHLINRDIASISKRGSEWNSRGERRERRTCPRRLGEWVAGALWSWWAWERKRTRRDHICLKFQCTGCCERMDDCFLVRITRLRWAARARVPG